MKLDEFLKSAGLTQRRFAEMVGVTEASMGRYSAGKRVPRPPILRRISDASGGQVRANDFFAATQPAAPAPSDTADPDDLSALPLDMLICDMCGVLRGKRLPPGSLAKFEGGGVVMPGSTYALDITGGNVETTGGGISDGDPDYPLYPVPGTLAPVPWSRKPAAQLLASMYHDDGRPYHLDPRHLLAGVIQRFRDIGLTPVVALELEFYLLDRERDAAGRPQPPLSPLTGRRAESTQVYGMDDLDAAADVMDDIAAACVAQAIPASVAIAEYAPSQFEINLNHQADALAAADHAVLLKRAIKGVARRHGLEATFMAKPFAASAGNGLHIHISLLDGDGANIFDERRADGEQRLRHAVGGAAATMAESMAIFGPNANSYRRLQPDTYAPLAPTWGFNNRTVALRIPAGSGMARRVEHRTAGADANPYLVAAAVLAGIHHGLTKSIDPGPPIAGNAYEQVPQSLPSNWLDAIRAFDAGTVLPGYLGADYARAYSACKRSELAQFNKHITATEHDWYLTAL